MSKILQLRRGKSDSIPQLKQGEIVYTTDTMKVYVGDGIGDNIEVGGDPITTTSIVGKDLFLRTAGNPGSIKKATHTEGSWTPSPQKYYKLKNADDKYDITTGTYTDAASGTTFCAIGEQIATDLLSSSFVETTQDDAVCFLDANGCVYPYPVQNYYLYVFYSSVTFDGATYHFTSSLTNNTLTLNADTAQVYTLNTYPSAGYICSYLSLYDTIIYGKGLGSSEDAEDLVDYIKNDGNNYIIIDTKLHCAYVVKIESEGIAYDTISYYDKTNQETKRLALYSELGLKPSYMETIAYAELVSLKDNNKLTPGKWYRMTGYNCTINSAYQQTTYPYNNLKSAGHTFDIILQAVSENKLSEHCRAVQTAGDTYFSKCNLAAWDIKYDITGGVDKYPWSTGTTGTIYYMKDEFGNECNYDFKNILMARTEVYQAEGVIDVFDKSRFFSSTKNILPTWTIGNVYYFYTFSFISADNTISDISVAINDISTDSLKYINFGNNKINSRRYYVDDYFYCFNTIIASCTDNTKTKISDITFSNSSTIQIQNNILMDSCLVTINCGLNEPFGDTTTFSINFIDNSFSNCQVYDLFTPEYIANNEFTNNGKSWVGCTSTGTLLGCSFKDCKVVQDNTKTYVHLTTMNNSSGVTKTFNIADLVNS